MELNFTSSIDLSCERDVNDLSFSRGEVEHEWCKLGLLGLRLLCCFLPGIIYEGPG